MVRIKSSHSLGLGPSVKAEAAGWVNPRVSVRSYFNDDVWLFYEEIPSPSTSSCLKRINWDWRLPNGDSFLLPKYSSLLQTLKELCLLLITTHVKPRTVIPYIANWRRFVFFLISRPKPVCRFQDVLPSEVEAFFDFIKPRNKRGKGALSAATVAIYYLCLNYLYDHRDNLTDGLRFRASGKLTAAAKAQYKALAKDRKTKFIPDEEAKKLLRASVQYIEEYAPLLLHWWGRLNTLCRSEQFNHLCRGLKLEEIRRVISDTSGIPATAVRLRNGFDRVRVFKRELIHLRTACFICIGFCTGMRLGEILSIKTGCISSKEMRNHGQFYWITGTLYKTEASWSGSIRTWMCGPLAAKAVRVLETMTALFGASKETPYLFTTLDPVSVISTAKARSFSVPTQTVIRSDLRRFSLEHGVKIDIHPHMFRRTFARNIIRFDKTSLLALKEHFKHWSLYMTDWYVGLDPDLIGELEIERQILSIELLEKICASTVSGPGGRRWTIELTKRIEEGRLPRSFRGKAGSEYRKPLIKDLHSAGIVVVPCGPFTYCVFNKSQARCTTGDRPLPNLCKPVECANSFITEEHVPAHKIRLAEIRPLYAALSDTEKSSPLGRSYALEIKNIQKAIEPFEG